MYDLLNHITSNIIIKQRRKNYHIGLIQLYLFSKEATLYSFHQGFSLVCDHSRILLYIAALTETRCGLNH